MDGVSYIDLVRFNCHPFEIYSVEYNLNAEFAQFTGVAGFKDDFRSGYRWEFRISTITNGAEQILWQAFVTDGKTSPISISVAGVRRLVLSVRLAQEEPISAEPTTDYPVIWANPRLHP